MSSPIHHADDIDPALIYAPPKVRDGTRRPQQRFSGDVAMLRLQLQLALDPEAVPEPPGTERITRAASDAARALWPTVLRLGAVAAVAAAVAWGIIQLPSPKKWGALLPGPINWGTVVLAQEPTRVPVHRTVQRPVQRTLQQPVQQMVQKSVQEPAQQPVQPSLQMRAEAPPTESGANRVKLVHMDLAAATPALSPEKFVATSEPVSTEPPAVAAPSVPAPPSSSPSPDNQEIATLVKRGKDFLVNGDFASARLLLKRAAEAGSADGALALGATFDPDVIKRLGAIGAAPDIAKARDWYQKAAELGSPAAAQQLAKLTPAQ